MRRRGFTLLEITVVLAIVALAARILLPRLADTDRVALDGAARRLVDGVAFGRERAILGGTPMRLVLDLDAGRWRVGRPGRAAAEVRDDAGPGGGPVTLPERVRVARATVGDGSALRAGVAVLDFAPEGDGLPARVELADGRGRTRSVVVPAGGGRAVVLAPETP